MPKWINWAIKYHFDLLVTVFLVIFFCLLALSIAGAAEPGTPPNQARIAYTLPTQNTDGSPLAPADINGIEIQHARSASGPWSVLITQAPNVTSYLHTAPPAGNNCYRALTVVGTTTQIKSDPSNVACKNVLGTPNPPAVTVD